MLSNKEKAINSLNWFIRENIRPQFFQNPPTHIIYERGIQKPFAHRRICLQASASNAVVRNSELRTALTTNRLWYFHSREENRPRFYNAIFCVLSMYAGSPNDCIMCDRSDLSRAGGIPIAAEWYVTLGIES